MACIECCAARRRTAAGLDRQRLRQRHKVEAARGQDCLGASVLPNGQRVGHKLEQFELKCYTLSANCLLLNVDRRCPWTRVKSAEVRARPLGALAEGRQFLDDPQLKPERLSKVSLLYDSLSDQIVDKRVSECSLEAEGEGELASSGGHLDLELAGSGADKEQLVEELTNSSFVVLEGGLDEGEQEQASGQRESGATEGILERSFSGPLALRESPESVARAAPAAEAPPWLEVGRPLGRGSSTPPAMISYNHAEAGPYAVQLHAALQRLGVRAYLDVYEIAEGTDWQDSLNRAILGCSVFVALVTRSYGETLWTRRECKLADLLAKRILPVNFKQARWPPASLALQFATLQYVDWRPRASSSPADSPPANSSLAHSFQSKAHSSTPFSSKALSSATAQPPQTVGGPDDWPAECVEEVARRVQLCLRAAAHQPHKQSPEPIRRAPSRQACAPELNADGWPSADCHDSGYHTSGELAALSSGLGPAHTRAQRRPQLRPLIQRLAASYGSTTCASGPAHSPGASSTDEDLEPQLAAASGAPNGLLLGQPAGQTEEEEEEARPKGKRRRRSLGGRAIRVLSKVKRSVVSYSRGRPPRTPATS